MQFAAGSLLEHLVELCTCVVAPREPDLGLEWLDQTQRPLCCCRDAATVEDVDTS
jgi:hypothetical protein